MRVILSTLPECAAMTAYLADPSTSAGVVAALLQAARELFQGRFAMAGTLGMCRTLRRANGKTVFVCPDGQRENETGAVFAAILDLCLQEALSRAEGEGSVYLLLDDVCALPKLDHLAAALRCGGAKGLRVVAALSGIGSLKARYGEAGAEAVLNGFGAVIAFALRENEARETVRAFYGLRTAENAPQQGRPPALPEPVITDGDLSALQTGECIVCVPQVPPFRFRMKPYKVKP